MPNYYRNLLPLLIVLFSLLSACQHSVNPKQVADKFWRAAINKNTIVMKRLTSKQSYNKGADFSVLHKVQSYSLGKVTIEDNIAELETRVVFDDPQKPFTIKTYLLMDDGDWLIDYQRTASFFSLNQEMTELMDDIEHMAEQFADQLEHSFEEFRDRALPKIQSKVEEAEKELKEKLPEIKDKLDEFLEELERSIEEAMPKQEPETTRT